MNEIKFNTLSLNPYNTLNNDWMLITSGNITNFNTMTISWGHFGCLWNLPTVVVYVRPQRYTKKFVDENDIFTLSVFDSKYKKDLAYLGSHSGRDENKLSKTSLTAIEINNTVGFKEAKYTFVCRKLYQDKIEEKNFLDQKVMDKCYPQKDFHDLYIAEIIKVYEN